MIKTAQCYALNFCQIKTVETRERVKFHKNRKMNFIPISTHYFARRMHFKLHQRTCII